MLGCTDVIGYIDGLEFSKDNGTCIASDWWFTAIPELKVVTGKLILQVVCDHPLFINLTLLDSQYGWFCLLKELLNPVLLDYCPYTVHIPGPDS